jgi:protein-tyrosine phosphatase
MYVANADYANNFEEKTSPKFDVIINLTDQPVTKRSGVKIINFPIVDEHYYLRFSQNTVKVNAILEILDEIVDKNETVLLCCMAGTNRSPFIAALFGKKHNNKLGQWYIDYIEDEKLLQGYENWDTFSNISYIHRLEQQ